MIDTVSTQPELRSIDPLRALGALAKLRADPNDTMQVFAIIEALSGNAPLRALDRLRADPDGRRLLQERPQILPLLLDRAGLARMPHGSLAHAYLGFIERENITADGLVQASLEGSDYHFARESELTFFRERMRDTHDLWHVVTGFQGDVVGEISLLAFNFAQLRNPGVGMVVAGGLAELKDLRVAKLVARTVLMGLRSAWLPAVHWEDLLALPLEQVRKQLRVEAAPAYEPLRMPRLQAA